MLQYPKMVRSANQREPWSSVFGRECWYTASFVLFISTLSTVLAGLVIPVFNGDLDLSQVGSTRSLSQANWYASSFVLFISTLSTVLAGLVIPEFNGDLDLSQVGSTRSLRQAKA